MDWFFIIGVFIGVFLGFIVAAILGGSRRSNDCADCAAAKLFFAEPSGNGDRADKVKKMEE